MTNIPYQPCWSNRYYLLYTFSNVDIAGGWMFTQGTRGNTCSNRNIHIKTNCERVSFRSQHGKFKAASSEPYLWHPGYRMFCFDFNWWTIAPHATLLFLTHVIMSKSHVRSNFKGVGIDFSWSFRQALTTRFARASFSRALPTRA